MRQLLPPDGILNPLARQISRLFARRSTADWMEATWHDDFGMSAGVWPAHPPQQPRDRS